MEVLGYVVEILLLFIADVFDETAGPANKLQRFVGVFAARLVHLLRSVGGPEFLVRAITASPLET